MAETYTRIHGVPKPNVDIKFDDVWTDPNVRAKDASFAYAYAALTTTAAGRSRLRHELDGDLPHHRQLRNAHPSDLERAAAGRATASRANDNTCNTCHSPTDAMGAAQVPAAQLDLVGRTVARRSRRSSTVIANCCFRTIEQEVMNGALVDQPGSGYRCERQSAVPDGRERQPDSGCQRQPIPVLVTVATSPPMSPAGALASPRFFSRFNPGGTHAGWLTPRRIEADLGMGGHWRTVFQRPVCGAARLTTHSRRGAAVDLVEDRDSDRPETDDGISDSGHRWCSRRWRSRCPPTRRYQPEVVVSDPYIDLHTGPGRGYPIFYVAAQGDHITILKEQTEWYKMRTPRGKEGWVNVSQMSSTLDLDGQPIDFPEYGLDEFAQAALGRSASAAATSTARAFSARTGTFALTPNISAELVGVAGPGRLLRRLHGHGQHRHVAVSRSGACHRFSTIGTGMMQRETADDDRAVGGSHR